MSSPAAAAPFVTHGVGPIVRVQQARDCALLQRELQPGAPFSVYLLGLPKARSGLESSIILLSVGRSGIKRSSFLSLILF